MKHERLLSQLDQAKSLLTTLVTTGELPDGQKLSDLSIDELETVIVTTDKFFNSLRSALNYIELLRQMQTPA
jgi:hypothetical protein